MADATRLSDVPKCIVFLLGKANLISNRFGYRRPFLRMLHRNSSLWDLLWCGPIQLVTLVLTPSLALYESRGERGPQSRSRGDCWAVGKARSPARGLPASPVT